MRLARTLGLALVTLMPLPAWAQAPARSTVIVSTTTSVQDSGLLDVLVPIFEKRTGHGVKTIAVGTGQALALAARGEADVTLAHAPAVERRYVAEGKLLNRRLVMYNDFIIVGPAGDPARVRGLAGATEALRRIAETRSRFVSRGDRSGTHMLEVSLWQDAGVSPAVPWYIESGQGMGATLGIANERRAYALTDRATFLALARHLALAVLVEKDRALLNMYSVLEAQPGSGPRVNAAGGKAFADFMVSAEAQALIRAFGTDRYGQPLFVPAAGRREEDLP